MRELINWKDHTVQYPNRFVKTEEGDYTFLEKSPGTIKQQGTAQNAKNFNTMDLAALEAMLMANENARMLIRHGQSLENDDTRLEALEAYTGTITENSKKLKGIVGEVVEATLTNTQEYPFNDSTKTLQLTITRTTKDYTIFTEVVSTTGGSVGEFEISDKLLNGFKISFTGSAKSVTARCYVRGGI